MGDRAGFTCITVGISGLVFSAGESLYCYRPRYVAAGDTIRFRAFLVDATLLNQKKNGSKYVYVELTNPFGDNVKRIKILRNDGIFAGYIPLDEDMPEGSYTLGGYTLFMKNQDDKYVFRKELPIKSQMASKYELKAHMEGNTLVTSLTQKFSKIPVNANNVSLYSKNGAIREDVHKRSSLDFHISNNVRKNGVVKVKYDRYEKFVKLPPDTSSLMISFHPEGGYLIPDVMNRVGFKIIGNNGLGKDISGKIMDSDGNEIAKLESTHLGMGSFTFIPKQREKYKAVAKGNIFELPIAEPKASVVSVKNMDDDSITISVLGKLPTNAILLVNNSGIPKFATTIKTNIIKLTRKGLGQGLVQLLLLDDSGKILSSRLIFNRDGYIYGDSIQKIPEGDYAVSIRSDSFAPCVGKSIVAELMLQSELKGHIENPDYYFESDDTEHNMNLDNLLLTQGWERYDLPEVFSGNFTEPNEPMEIGGSLSGTVKSRWAAKPLKDAVVNVIAPSLKYVNVESTDSLGRFAIEGLDWQDGTVFALRAYNKNGNPEHNLVIDADISMPVPSLSVESTNFGENDDYKFSNGAVWLDELEVKAYKSDEEQRLDMLKSLGVKMVTSEEIEANHYTSYEEVIRKIPGLRIENGNLVNMGSKANLNNRHAGNVELWVDGVRWQPSSNTNAAPIVGSFDDRLFHAGPLKALTTYTPTESNTFTEFLSAYPINMIEYIQYYRPSIAMVISQSAAAGAGALVMTTKNGSKVRDWDKDLFVKSIQPLGYQRASDSYKPHFSYDSTGTEYIISSAWYPSIADLKLLHDIDNKKLIINGISNNGLPISIKRLE